MYNSKYNLVKKLKNKKIIVGNGFDLNCGLETSYKNYFESKKTKYNYLYEFKNRFMKNIDSIIPVLDYSDWARQIIANTYYAADLNEIRKLNTNVWDMYFTMNFYDAPDQRWCDIEKYMLLSLTNIDCKEDKISSEPMTFWQKVRCHYCRDKSESLYPKLSREEKIMVLFIDCIQEKEKEAKSDFYGFLYSELLAFEHEFGEYVLNETKKEFYNDNANSIINEFTYNMKDISSIDSFNYTKPLIFDKVHSFLNINGNTSNPIFGIDEAIVAATEPSFIFTKIARRLNRDMNSLQCYKSTPFENLVVYGHSLDEHDYSYFFPLFDYLKIDNIESNFKIVFAYTNYKPEIKDKIYQDTIQGIANIISAYEHYRFPERKEHRLLDSLVAQGKLVTYEIPCCEIPKKQSNVD